MFKQIRSYNYLYSFILAASSITPAFATLRAPEPGYPSGWWKEFSYDGAPQWEILPQDCGPGEVILSKRTELGVFSNFAPTPITLDGVTYASLEGFWQMMKYPENATDPRATFPGIKWPFTREQVGQMTAFEAKHAGDLGSKNMAAMNIDWVTYRGEQLTYRTLKKGRHYELIKQATWAKLNQHPELKALLLKTGTLILKPDHTPEKNSPPEWLYFELYMDIRSQLQRSPMSF